MTDRHANRVPPVGSAITLRTGETMYVACGWYAPGEGGWRIMLTENADKSKAGHTVVVGLRDIRRPV